MARIGNKPIALGDEVRVEVGSDNEVTVAGPKGELSTQVDSALTVETEDGRVRLERPSDAKHHREVHGLYRSLLDNMVTGVVEGYRKELEIIGIGFRAQISGGVLELALGFSHPIHFVPPESIDVTVESGRGQNPTITIEGIDKQLVGQVAAKIRSLRPPEPYKGKGIRYVGEHVERKAGKTAVR